MIKFTEFVAEKRVRHTRARSSNSRSRVAHHVRPLELIVINPNPKLWARIRKLLGAAKK